MPRRPERTGGTQRPAPSSEPVPLVDRELRNPYVRFLMHLGVPVSVSIGLHVLLFAFLALRSWQVFGGGLGPDEYEVGITDAAPRDAEEGLKWPGEHLPDLDASDTDLEIDPFEFSRMIDRADLRDLVQNEVALNP